MISVLADIHLAESVVGHKFERFDSPIKKFQKYEHKIFQKHQIDSATYIENYNYYANDLNTMRVIYQGVTDTLTQRKKEILSKRRKES